MRAGSPVTGHEVAADLYRLDPEAFTGARNALVKELRAGGRREDAARVAKLRRPSPTAWALNQVARRRPDVVEAVLDAGGELREATAAALAGDRSELRDAQAAERRAVDAAVAVAAKVLTDAGKGVTDAARIRMAGSLRAAVVDPAVADLLREGVLDADRDAPGFGLDGVSAAAAARRTTPPDRAATRPAPEHEEAVDTDASEAGRRRASAEADEAEDAARRLEREAADAERRAAQLAAAAADAAAEAERAIRRAEQVDADAKAAAERATVARAEAEAADVRARQARRRAEST